MRNVMFVVIFLAVTAFFAINLMQDLATTQSSLVKILNK